MARILIHVNGGPETPARAASALLAAKSALDEGHSVSLFVAGDAVRLVRDAATRIPAGLGARRLREHIDAALAKGARLYLSGGSAPRALMRLSTAHDRMMTY